MARRKPPPAPKKPPAPAKRRKEVDYDPVARSLAMAVRNAHGIERASTFDMSEELGAPRGYIGTRNSALDRALGTPGIPLGRVTEISGWHGAGKSTALDQILAETQAQGGVAALADIERARLRSYMFQLGVTGALVEFIGGTIEGLFSEVETLIRHTAHWNAIAWYEALSGVPGLNVPKLRTYLYAVPNPDDPGNPKAVIAKLKLAQWERGQAAALMEWQKAHGLSAFGIRDQASREILRPALFPAIDEDGVHHPDWEAEAREAWAAGEDHVFARPADQPVVIGWDSVGGTPAKEEMAANAYASRGQPAVAARVIKYNFRRLIQMLANEAIAFVLVNQRYERIMQKGFQKPPSETYGGGGIKFHSTIRIELDKVGDLWRGSNDKENGIPPLGQVVRIKIPKNKVESPFRIEEYGLVYGRGVDNAFAWYQDFKARGIIRVSGGWSSFADPTVMGPNTKAFHGWKGLSDLCATCPQLWTSLQALYSEGRK